MHREKVFPVYLYREYHNSIQQNFIVLIFINNFQKLNFLNLILFEEQPPQPSATSHRSPPPLTVAAHRHICRTLHPPPLTADSYNHSRTSPPPPPAARHSRTRSRTPQFFYLLLFYYLFILYSFSQLLMYFMYLCNIY